MRALLALVIALPLCGCLGAMSQEQIAAQRAQIAANDDARCRSYGAAPGSDVYIQCRMAQDQRRDAAANAAAQAAAIRASEPMDPIPANDAPRLGNILPQTTRCQSVPSGGGTWQTVCR
jgi:hypothetical protein